MLVKRNGNTRPVTDPLDVLSSEDIGEGFIKGQMREEIGESCRGRWAEPVASRSGDRRARDQAGKEQEELVVVKEGMHFYFFMLEVYITRNEQE